MDLTQKHCVPCEGGVAPFPPETIAVYLPKLKNAWTVVEDKKLYSVFIFKDFAESLEFVNKVGKIAEKENHHPDISINYNKVALELMTHAIGGLSENDFILAAKIEQIEQKI
jgi:4a-hydroxytetrahydrobiopterin dehydratase